MAVLLFAVILSALGWQRKINRQLGWCGYEDPVWEGLLEIECDFLRG